MSSKNSQLSALIETALVAAFAMALSYIPDFASWFTPSFGAVPVVLFALRRGPKYGTLAGLIWGLLHFILGKVWYLALSQVIIEYIITFVSMGLAGFLSAPFQNALSKDNKGRALITQLSVPHLLFLSATSGTMSLVLSSGEATHQKACHLTFIRSVSMVQLDC